MKRFLIISGIICVALTVATINHVALAGDAATTSDAYKCIPAKPFYMGVYIYEGHLGDAAQEAGMEYFEYFESQLAILRGHGVNAIYLAVHHSRGHFDRLLELTAKYGIKLIPQLDFVYFRENWTDEQMQLNAKLAGEFILKYVNHPQVLAWSVGEEVSHDSINKLCRYYFMIRSHVPDVKFHLINNNLGAAKDMPVPDPHIMGTDRYAFWWEMSGDGYRASPSFALSWTRSEADRYYWEAARRGADYMLVITQGGLTMPGTANSVVDIGSITYPTTEGAKKTLQERIMMFAEEGRMGWKKFDTSRGARYNFWKYYRLPANCMKALAWTSVLEGARLFFCWSYNPPTKSILATTFESAASTDLGEVILINLAGRPGEPNPQLEEFATAGTEIRRFERIITSMRKLQESPVDTDTGKGYFNRAFSYPGLRGKVVVVHNADVGTWPGESRNFFLDSDPIYIDDNGNLVDYKPHTEPAKVVLTPKEVCACNQNFCTCAIYALDSKTTLTKRADEYILDVLPGSGTLIFVGPGDEAWQLRKLVK